MDRLSHELRTSLTGIVGYAEYLEAGSSDPMMNFTANIIRESGKNLTRTSQSFFDFYLLSQGQIRLKCSRFVFSELVRGIVSQHQTMASAREVSLGFTCADAALEVVVSSDRDRLHQVLEALVFGVLQASDKWSMVHVHLELDQGRRELFLTFVSSGVSVSPPQIQWLSQFWNTDDYHFKLQEGPGIELALAKAMIYFLDGTVMFEHSVEVPTRLMVKFPANRSSFSEVFS
jgi:signal transduction histidine kinase